MPLLRYGPRALRRAVRRRWWGRSRDQRRVWHQRSTNHELLITCLLFSAMQLNPALSPHSLLSPQRLHTYTYLANILPYPDSRDVVLWNNSIPLSADGDTTDVLRSNDPTDSHDSVLPFLPPPHPPSPADSGFHYSHVWWSWWGSSAESPTVGRLLAGRVDPFRQRPHRPPPSTICRWSFRKAYIDIYIQELR